ncbi:PTS mannose transporter subunit IID [Tyzzerella sp. An114]|uniref:mannose/fructose/sorbose PTS transporter subunit IID n=1 Tax=Tyzzerella sp. An114 TaxID=1965545 RepID=UPI000B450956|nr:mannose/fructose/sorbose PTS transporter subunit IID [Tyzzerella sp. An114]OUQ55605.1 PTS mannose transporter subunit IID [Tyzzerella sp. An114]
MENKNTSEKKLTKGDLINIWIRSNFQQASFNFERIHALGFCFDMVPAIKRLYKTKEEQVAALKRHLLFFNVTPACTGPILGVVGAMEETKANGADINDGTINSIKVGLMGPFCGVGDPVMWGTLRPITAALGASLALGGSFLGPVLFFVLFNAFRLAFLWFGLDYGYRKGLDMVKDLSGNILQKLTEGASILGLFVMGALVSKWTTINVPIVVSTLEGAGGTMVQTTVQNILDQLLPGLLPLVLTLFVCRLLKKRMSPILLIFIIFFIGIAGSYFGFLA